MSYKENPKTKGSGIVCSIPQTGTCPNQCEDCFFQSGRSYLEPLSENLPNLPDNLPSRVVRINDGNDSNVERQLAVDEWKRHDMAFFNTAIPNLDFPGPVVLTVNPWGMIDSDFRKIAVPPENLMFVRFRANMWNIPLMDECVEYYSKREVPIVLTFMAYFNSAEVIPEKFAWAYKFRKRTLNSYWAITTDAWEAVMQPYKRNKWVYSCGKIEGEHGDTHCRFCGNCLREYFATVTRMTQKEKENV